jgi:hypothetical protein
MLPGGGPATEDVTMAWSGKKVMTFTSTASMSDGSKVLFSGRGTRAGR